MIKQSLILSLCTPLLLFDAGQVTAQNTLSGKPEMAYSYVREADIMWMKRVWRRIDLRQKANMPFYFPENPSQGRKALFQYLIMSIQEGTLSPYDPGVLGDNDMLDERLNEDELNRILVAYDTVESIDVITRKEIYVPIETTVSSTDILMYEIKEDWFFDRQRSTMEVRIVAICPLLTVRDSETGEFRGYKRLFWISFQEARPEMANWLCYNDHNDAETRTYEEVFEKRMFQSYIVKESNVYDRYISAYRNGVEVLIESQRIAEELMVMEHDLWSY